MLPLFFLYFFLLFSAGFAGMFLLRLISFFPNLKNDSDRTFPAAWLLLL